METYDFGPATATMSRLVRGVTDEQLTAPTPCPKYTVADLVDHIGGLTIAFTGAATKTPVPGAGGGGQGDGSRLEEGWRDRIAGDLERLAAAWAEPAAYDGTTMAGPIEMPGPEAAAVALNEVVVHGWDLAQGTGHPSRPTRRRSASAPGSPRRSRHRRPRPCAATRSGRCSRCPTTPRPWTGCSA
jgi:uncharacterized protein (TIGR03086 family)